MVQIGSGGDFLIAVQGQPHMQAESSGIRDDPKGYESTKRLKSKCAQVLTSSHAGYASVVAFSHPPNQCTHCRLHYVSQTAVGSNYPKAKPRKRKAPSEENEMNTMLVDRDGTASRLAAAGKAALGDGDTERARAKYSEAAALFETRAGAAVKSNERHLLLFLAASHYFYGGAYAQAQRVFRRVERRLLPRDVQHLFEPFARDVEERAHPDYAATIRTRVFAAGKAGRHADALEILKAHPFVFDQTGLAFVRAYLCEELKRYHAAALFYLSAMQSRPNDPGLDFLAASLPLSLPGMERLDEAWEYVQYQLKEIDHAITYVSASLVCYRRASQAEVLC